MAHGHLFMHTLAGIHTCMHQALHAGRFLEVLHVRSYAMHRALCASIQLIYLYTDGVPQYYGSPYYYYSPYYPYTYYGYGTGSLVIYSISCQGNEAYLSSCSYAVSSGYGHSFDGGVRCYGNELCCWFILQLQ